MSETDALLPDKPGKPNEAAPPVTLRDVWTLGSKAWLVAGTCGGLLAGGAAAATVVVFGRVLEMMARATTDGLRDTLVVYGWLVLTELLASWIQFFAWSRTVIAVEKQIDTPNVGGYVEGLGAVCAGLGQGITAAVISLAYGWDSLLVVVVALAFVAASSFVVVKGIARCFMRSKPRQDGTIESAKDKQNRIEWEMDQLWRHAPALRRFNATDFVVQRVEWLVDDSHPSSTRLGMMAIMLQLMFFPVVVTLLYTAWKVDSTHPRDVDSAVNVVIVFVASYQALSSLQRAKTTYRKGDFSIKKTNLLSHDTTQSSPERRAAAASWIRSLAAPFSPSRTCTVGVSIIFVTLYVAMAIDLGYTSAWLLVTPLAQSSSMSTAWKLALGVLACGALIGLAWDLRIQAQAKPTRRVRTMIIKEVVAARLRLSGETLQTSITPKSLLKDSTIIAMCVSSLMEPKCLSGVTLVLAGLIGGVTVDPRFTLASLVLAPLGYTDYFLHQRRDKSLYRSLISPESSSIRLLYIGEALVRAMVQVLSTVTTIVLAYLQVSWVADGSSTIYSVLVVAMIGSVCFAVAHASQFASGGFVQDEALNAAALLLDYVQLQPSTGVLIHETNNTIDSLALNGDLRIEALGMTPTQSVSVVPGECVDVDKPLADVVVSSVLETRIPGFAFAGGIDVSSLPSSFLLDRIVVINSDPVKVPGTIRDNIQLAALHATSERVVQAAKDAGFRGDDLDYVVSCDDWEGAHTEELKKRILLARVLLRKPDVVLAETLPTASGEELDLTESINAIRKRLHECKVVVLRREADL